MATKYRFEYTGISGIDYKCDLSNDDYVGSVIDIKGRAHYGMNSIDGANNPIKSKYLNISVQATTTQDLSDLFATDERYWKVEFYRDSSLIFFGYLSSEGSTQDFISDVWDIDFNCLDPLAFLEDLAYVDLVGAAYTGLEETIVVVANALKRAFPDQTDAFDIVAYLPYDYKTSSTSYTAGAFPTDSSLDQDVWTDADSGETKSCQEVLKDVLGSLGLYVMQKDGAHWVIGHYLYDMLNINAKYVNSFDKDGTGIADITLSPFTNQALLQDTSSPTYQVVHCNKDQNYHYKRSLQELAVDNIFKYRAEIISNPTFDGGTTGGTMPGWTIDSSTYAYSTSGGLMRIYTYDPNTSRPLAIYSETFGVDVYEAFRITGKFKPNYDGGGIFINMQLESDAAQFFVIRGPDDNPYWGLVAGGRADRSIVAENGEEVEFEIDLPPVNIAGEMRVEVYAARNDEDHAVPDTSKYLELYDLNITGLEAERKGFTHRGSYTDEQSLKTDKTEVFLSATRSETLANGMFKTTLDTALTGLKNANRASYYDVGRNFLIDLLSYERRRKVFNGSFYNWFDTDSFVIIAELFASGGTSVGNRWAILAYEFDTYNNTGTLTVEELHDASITGDYDYELKAIYGETIEPTIVS